MISLDNLTVSYGGWTLFDNISLLINPKDRIGLVGKNGAGKTTTIRMISTLIKPTSGDAEVDGHSIIKEPEKVRRSITYLPDEAGAYKTMTGRAYLKFMAGMFAESKAEITEFTARAEKTCGLGDRLNEKIGSYSRGMIRKLLLSRAVMTRPKLAILDEPTSGLDVINALEIRKMIKELSKTENMSFLLSSHNMLEIEFVSDRVGIIAGGRLLAVGKINELKEKYNSANLEEVFEKVVKQNEISYSAEKRASRAYKCADDIRRCNYAGYAFVYRKNHV